MRIYKLILTLILLLPTLAWTHSPRALTGEFYVFADKDKAHFLQNKTDLVVDHVSENGFELYGPNGTEEYLVQLGLTYIRLDSENKNEFEPELESSYPSFEQVSKRLKNITSRYPHLARLFSIGKSVQGRDLWFVKISNNPDVDQIKPEFKYISSMHGDEITGRELMLNFIEDLLAGYGKDARITHLIDNTEIYIMPSMNPDGSEMKRRWNGNSRDLNRDFPEMTRNDQNDWAGRQPETQAVMQFQAQRKFALSANFHGGAVCVNYPWDATYTKHPFDNLVVNLSLAYADLNSSMRNSRSFDRGITNGAAWYVLKGGMQDWSYNWHNDLQVTVELSQQKWPSYSNIPAFYQENRESLFVYLEKIHQGSGFKLKNNQSGTVKIYDQAGVFQGSFGFSDGEFYKVLPIGQYRFEIKTQNNQLYTVETEVNADTRGTYHIL